MANCLKKINIEIVFLFIEIVNLKNSHMEPNLDKIFISVRLLLIINE